MSDPLFALYVIWHPSFTGGLEMAEQIRTHFGRDLYRMVDGAPDVSVVYRSEPMPGVATPKPIDWADATFTVAVVLADAGLVDDREWTEYIGSLSREARARGSFAGFFPVTVDPHGIDFGFDEQAVRWDLWDQPDTERYLRLRSDLTYEFCRMVRSGIHRIQHGSEPPLECVLENFHVFISHTKRDRDGESVARVLRDWIHENSQFSSFFDVHDIPPGQSFRDVILHQIGVGVVMAVHTDSYSSREWCRLEVIEAKRRLVPMVVVDCVPDIDPRGIPYLGNVPVIRIDPGLTDRIATVAGCLLDELFRSWLWRYRIEPYRSDSVGVLFSARPPELIVLAALPAVQEDRDAAIVYSEPVLGTDEVRLFSDIAPEVDVLTMKKWLEGRR